MSHPATSDRTWPLPRSPWVMRMVWSDLLFMHWSVSAAILRPLIPPEIEIETYDGSAWIGLVPFSMSGIRPRGLPPLPGASAFPELNVRTYVTVDDRPGVWFFSLDAAHRLAVWAARRFFHLPYFNADITSTATHSGIRYASRRTHRAAAQAEFAADYQPTGDVYRAVPGSLEHWLTARYCLYSANGRGQVFRGEIDHAPWPLQPATAELHRSNLTEWLGFHLPDMPPVLQFAKSVDVHAWLIRRI